MIRGAVVVKPQAPAPTPARTTAQTPTQTGAQREPTQALFEAWLNGASTASGGSSTPGAAQGPGAAPGPNDATTTPRPQWVMPEAGESPKWLRRAHLFVAGLFVLAVVVAAVFNSSPVAPEDDVAGTTDDVAPLFDLRVGECFDLEETESGTITDVTVRPCDREHTYELFLTERLTGVGYPTDDDWDVYFEDECVPAFAEYVGAPYESSVLDIYWIVPNLEGWRQGDRTIQCAVYHPNIPRLTAPLKGVGPGGGGEPGLDI
jgi:hypothetical protein